MGFSFYSSKSKTATDKASEHTLTEDVALTKPQIKRATRTRRNFSLLTSFFLLTTLVFLILVEIGSVHNAPVIRKIYFIKLDLSNVIPVSVPNSVLLNSIAQTLGLHDFYQVGLWNYCEGYNANGVSSCAPTQTLYWFNPVKIIEEQLIAGGSIQLPDDLTSILNIIEVASNWMFALFLSGACLTFVLIFLMFTSVYTRWVTFLLTILTFINALAITAASVIATVMFVIMRNVFLDNSSVNIGAELGLTMFVCMWIASGFAIAAWLFQMGMCCCCASRRDVRRGKKRGSEKAYYTTESEK